MALNLRIGQKVSILSVLRERGLLEGMRQGHDRIQGPCPIHGGDNTQAFVVTISKNLWYCFSGCRQGGDSVDLVRMLDGSSFHQALLKLEQRFPTAQVFPHREAPPQPLFRPFQKKLWLYPDSPFLHQKGIYPQTALFFETGEYRREGFLKECIGVRLHSPDGTPLGYAGRRLHPSDINRYGKWKLPSGLPKNTMLFNAHRSHLMLGRPIVVTECPWGVMRLHQLKIPAVALMGVHTSNFQLNLLKKARSITLLLDGDDAGVSGSSHIAEKLQNHPALRIVNLPKDKDPDDLNDRELSSYF